jgi:hypothetical protein
MKKNPKWTDELIERLRKYVDASRWYRVTWQDYQVHGIDPRKPEYGDAGWATFYLDKSCDDPNELEKYDPKEFEVVRLDNFDWTKQDPQPL